MKFNLAILSVLAARPEQRIPLDEVSREVKRMIAAGDGATQLKRSSELGDADVFEAGLASINDAGLQITGSGLSLWHSLEASRGERQRIEQESNERQERPDTVVADTRDALSGAVVDRTDDIDAAPEPRADVPIVFEPAFGSVHDTNRSDARLSRLVGLLASSMPKFARRRRRRSSDGMADRKAGDRVGVTGFAVACLSLIAVVACVAAAIALGQNSTLKSDIATLRRELVPLRERLARLEQIETVKRDAAQQEAAQDKAEAEKKALDAAAQQAALNLSREEIQLVREYIKAAPSAGAGGPPVNVGDPITGGMIPLPSSLTEKVPRLIGAKFATRNGAIIISTRNSRRVDAVLTAN
ncbi:hypothetical protein HAP48_0033140 [Bradyrhizobium septentrionale]|uniref:Uncharacterized protein n=1 Tax=Bradyrhizobium septentrionale TaxID=1404411 RepID=A0A974A153_9BRAD|nr:hypothetical protein [Bradyrhizobium septentrionale]UGY13407.1 hypothetical protein HAP48_0033140 [Bradyrhizobium septentrionale]